MVNGIVSNGGATLESIAPGVQRTGLAEGATSATRNDSSTRTKLPLELARALYAPMPAEAIKPHPTKDYLSSVKAIFVIDRLNEVFGIGGWTYRTQVIESNPDSAMVVMLVVLKVPEYGIRLEQYGGSDNKDRGDAYKGAVTDALSKCGSYLGIAMDIYKGGGPTKVNPRGMAVAQSRVGAVEPNTQQPAPRPNTQAAADAVAAEKIRIRNPATSRPWTNRGEMKREFGRLRELVGEVAYLTELARYGTTTELNWKSADQATECWHHLDHMAAKAVA